MTKKETDKFYDNILKSLHGNRVTFIKQHYYSSVNEFLDAGNSIEDIEMYFTVQETAAAIMRTRIEAEIKGYAPELLEDDEIKEWWKQVYEVMGITRKEQQDLIKY